ncbi:MAG TPA: hypothetical protein VFO83_16405 [Aggregicoccus sp.]|nr:hypothetical protein [Aggregicoccus sp.]
MKRVLLCVLLAFGAGGCSFTEAIQDYCTETLLCACEGSDCCIKSGNACEEDLCCGRLVCGEGTCVQGPDMPFITIDPPGFEFGAYDVSGLAPEPSQVFTVTNVGTQPTAPLQRRLLGAVSDLSVVEDTCIDRALAPGEACTLRVDVTPTSVGLKVMRMGYFEAPDVDIMVETSVLIVDSSG